MTEPLIVTQSQLENHFGRLGEILAGVLSINVRMEVDWSLAPIAAGLVGNRCEFIPRNRGLRVPVAPLLHLRQGLWAWLGYREEWDHERANRDIRRYSFRSAGMTIYFGEKNDAFKPQMFRAKWAGWAKWSIDYSF